VCAECRLCATLARADINSVLAWSAALKQKSSLRFGAPREEREQPGGTDEEQRAAWFWHNG
jgi:hypothetical protein